MKLTLLSDGMLTVFDMIADMIDGVFGMLDDGLDGDIFSLAMAFFLLKGIGACIVLYLAIPFILYYALGVSLLIAGLAAIPCLVLPAIGLLYMWFY